MRVSDFDYYLPEELIAQYPAAHREDSRLLVLDRMGSGEITHTRFSRIVDLLVPGDLLVLNDTRVFPARLLGTREGTGGMVEILLLEERSPGTWDALVRPGRRARKGETILFGDGSLRCVIEDSTPEGGRVVRFIGITEKEFWKEVIRIGKVPLPPYIKRDEEEIDRERYQTVYARTLGSVAAPTAGLHFTEEILWKLKDKGVQVAFVLLHVGLGTFRPVRVADVERHQMHAEYWKIEPTAADLINRARQEGRRVIAVGTTTVRVLESTAQDDGRILPGEGWTRLFIYPGFTFRVIDGLITNFHLPRSTLLMLVCAFAGRERVLHAYREAVERQYRFFSYGDAMLVI